MKKLAKSIVKNPYFTIVGWLATMIALVLAIVIPYIQARKVLLDFSYKSYGLVIDGITDMEGFDVRFYGKKIRRVSVTTCEICNLGNVTIEDDDVYEGHELRVFTQSDNTEVLFVNMVSQSYDTNNCKIYHEDNSVYVHFDILEKNDKVVFNIYHTGNADAVFNIEGKIKDGEISVDRRRESDLKVLGMAYFFAMLMVLYCCLIWIKELFQDGHIILALVVLFILIRAIMFVYKWFKA